jgi:hypothetical protein
MTGFRRWATLSFRLQRWEVLASVAGVALLAVVQFWFAWQLRGIAATEPGCPDPQAYIPGCEALARRFQGLADWGTGLLLLSWGAPFAMGLLLGVPIVARDVEGRTAGIAWTLSRSRTHWLAGRVAFATVVLVALLAVVVVASGALAGAIQPNLHLERDFSSYGQRDWLIVARGLAALSLGVLAGAVVGRILPALLVATFASALVFAGVSLGMDRWNQTLAIVIDPYAMPDGGPEWDGAMGLGGGVQLPSGEFVSYSDIQADVQYGDESGGMYSRYDEEAQRPDPASFIGWERSIIVPGRIYLLVMARDSAVMVGIGVILSGLAVLAVRRRRPA